MKTLAVILILAGAITMITIGEFVATEEKVVDIGKVEIGKSENHRVSWSLTVGGVLPAVGFVTLLMSKKKPIG